MAEDRPNENPQWAESGAASVTAPSTSKRNEGWFKDESPAHDYENFMKRMYGKWLKHFGGTVSTFTTLLEAVGITGEFPLAEGDTCFIDEGYDPALKAHEPIEGFDPEVWGASAKMLRGICSDGKHLYIVHASPTNGNAAVIRRIIREDGSVDGTWSATTSAVMTNSGAVVWDLWTDGQLLVFASSAAVEVYDVVAGGSAIWSKAYTSFIHRRVWADATHIYVTDDDDVIAYDRATGAPSWTFDHGADVHAIASDGRYLYVFGATSGHASGADLRRLLANDGSSATAEGGTPAGTAPLWDFAFGVAPVDGGDIKLGRNGEIFISYTTGSPGFSNQVVSRRRGNDGSEEWVTGVGSSIDIGYRIAVDQDYVWGWQPPGPVSGSEPAPLTYGGASLGCVKQTTAGPARAYLMANPCSDGSFLWSGGIVYDGALTQVGTLVKWSRGSRVQHWRRVNPSGGDYTLPLQQLIVPA